MSLGPSQLSRNSWKHMNRLSNFRVRTNKKMYASLGSEHNLERKETRGETYKEELEQRKGNKFSRLVM